MSLQHPLIFLVCSRVSLHLDAGQTEALHIFSSDTHTPVRPTGQSHREQHASSHMHTLAIDFPSMPLHTHTHKSKVIDILHCVMLLLHLK